MVLVRLLQDLRGETQVIMATKYSRSNSGEQCWECGNWCWSNCDSESITGVCSNAVDAALIRSALGGAGELAGQRF